jgi:hypothetical protein
MRSSNRLGIAVFIATIAFSMFWGIAAAMYLARG